MAFHTQRAEAHVGHRCAFGQRVNIGRAQLMRIFRIMRVVAGGTGDCFVNSVGHVRDIRRSGMIDVLNKTGCRMTANAVEPCRPGRCLGRNRMTGVVPLCGLKVMIQAVVTLRATSRGHGRGN